MLEHSCLDLTIALAKSGSNVLDAVSPHGVIKDGGEECTRLFVVCVGMLKRVSPDYGVELLSVDSISLVFDWTVFRVWFVVNHGSLVAVC